MTKRRFLQDGRTQSHRRRRLTPVNADPAGTAGIKKRKACAAGASITAEAHGPNAAFIKRHGSFRTALGRIETQRKSFISNLKASAMLPVMARRKQENEIQGSLFGDLAPTVPAVRAPRIEPRKLNAPAAPTSTLVPPIPADCYLAEIAVDGPVAGAFTYRAENFRGQLAPGARVLVPFGGRTLPGFFVGEKKAEELAAQGIALSRLRPIIKVLETASQPLVTPTLLKLAHWMARHYAAPLGSTLSSMLPSGVRRGAAGARLRMVRATQPPEKLLEAARALLLKKPRQAQLLMALAAMPGAWSSDPAVADAAPQAIPIAAPELLAEAGAPDSALKALEKSGLLRIEEIRAGHDTDDLAHTDEHGKDLLLNAEQAAAFSRIEAALSAGTFGGFLLQGVTGSGKTEVYLRALKKALEMGRQGIVLVPEIALTPQTAQRFQQRLGFNRVAVLHSHVTDGDRADAWRAVRAGEIDVVVGARSALFAPLPRLGVIVVDEEHENAFKQDSTPRYHARDTALELARLSGAVVVLGSATPSFEALHAARTGKLHHLLLNARVAGRPLPPVSIIDMGEENRESGRYNYLSERLVTDIARTLLRREQTILFMNRRGFSTVITCLRCGFTEKCEHYDITLTSHRGKAAAMSAPYSDSAAALQSRGETLLCHYCGYEKPLPEVCSGCGLPGVKHWGMGTERVEAEVRKAFPNARVARMDSDTMTRRTAYLEALAAFRSGQTDILIGTQMIAKGLDFPNVTLVGVVLADTALHMPDFRSRERTFQLLAQVAGRAGRGDKGGSVVIQTHLPADPAIRAAARHDFESFALQELQERRAFLYPPFTRLARILLRGKEQHKTREAATQLADALKAESAKQAAAVEVELKPGLPPPTLILGPSEPPIARLEGFFRQHIMIKARDSEALSALLNSPAGSVLQKLKGADAVVDVDPLNML